MPRVRRNVCARRVCLPSAWSAIRGRWVTLRGSCPVSNDTPRARSEPRVNRRGLRELYSIADCINYFIQTHDDLSCEGVGMCTHKTRVPLCRCSSQFMESINDRIHSVVARFTRAMAVAHQALKTKPRLWPKPCSRAKKLS